MTLDAAAISAAIEHECSARPSGADEWSGVERVIDAMISPARGTLGSRAWSVDWPYGRTP